MEFKTFKYANMFTGNTLNCSELCNRASTSNAIEMLRAARATCLLPSVTDDCADIRYADNHPEAEKLLTLF